MSSNTAIASAKCLAAAAAFLVTGAVGAQDEARENTEVITVEAPRVVRQEVGRTTTGAPIELISLTRRVSYADLDLKLHPDVMELEKRINDTAREACDQLAQLYPLGETDTRSCVDDAVESAMAQAQEVIAAAR